MTRGPQRPPSQRATLLRHPTRRRRISHPPPVRHLQAPARREGHAPRRRLRSPGGRPATGGQEAAHGRRVGGGEAGKREAQGERPGADFRPPRGTPGRKFHRAPQGQGARCILRAQAEPGGRPGRQAPAPRGRGRSGGGGGRRWIPSGQGALTNVVPARALWGVARRGGVQSLGRLPPIVPPHPARGVVGSSWRPPSRPAAPPPAPPAPPPAPSTQAGGPSSPGACPWPPNVRRFTP